MTADAKKEAMYHLLTAMAILNDTPVDETEEVEQENVKVLRTQDGHIAVPMS